MPFINVQGISIHYHQSEVSSRVQTTVIFVHGAGGTWKNWAYQLSDIEGYNLIALDLPGHGRSEGSPADLIKNYSEFILCFVQALSITQFVIAGHSMGGAIGMEFALTYPDALIGLIIVDSGARLRVNPKTLEVLSRGVHPTENIQYCYSREISEVVLKQAIEEMNEIPTGVFLADFKACDGFNIIDRVKTINLPALVICGEDDQMTPVKYSEFLAQELPQATISIIKNAGHMAMLEQPNLVNKLIQQFLEMSVLTNPPRVKPC